MRELDQYPDLGREPGAEQESDWRGPSGQWSRQAFRGNFYGRQGYTERPVDFDPRSFRADHRAHVQWDRAGDGGSQKAYTYQAAGSGSAAGGGGRQAPGWNTLSPARCFRYLVSFSGVMLVGSMMISRMRSAAAVHRVYS